MKEKLLQRIKETFDDHNIEFWLDSGALLGAIREGKFIEWDHDIDVGAWKEDLNKIKRACAEHGFSTHYDKRYDGNFMTVTGNVGSSFGILLFDKNNSETTFKLIYPTSKLGELCDVMLWCLKLHHAEQKQGSLPLSFVEVSVKICGILSKKTREKSIYVIQTIYGKLGGITVKATLPNSFFKDFKIIEFYDVELRVPSNYKDYLAFRYGEDWMIPQTTEVVRPGIWLERSGAKIEKFKGDKKIW